MSATKTGAERARRHRERKKNVDIQIAVGVAKLVLGQGPGEQRRAVKELLVSAAESKEVSEDYLRLIERALSSL